MQQITIVSVLAAFCFFILYKLLGFGPALEPEQTQLPEQQQEATTTPEFDATPYLRAMTLEEKVGQLFIIGHWSDTPATSTNASLRDYSFGGVVIMSAPENPNDIDRWTTLWRVGREIPPLIAIDQEGGEVTRLYGEGFSTTSQPSITEVDQAYILGQTRGAELSRLGITYNFAPVLEQATATDAFMYNRVFADSSLIAPLGEALIEGMDSSGVTAIPKHFPGHPNTPIDSHVELPVLPLLHEDFTEFISPFTEVLASAKPEALMTAHVFVPNIDSIYPATLSKTILTDILRTKFGFDGVVITDGLSMDAITSSFTEEEASILALQAGADMLLFAAEPEHAIPARQAILSAIETGELSEDRIDVSVARILKMKLGE